MNVPTSTIGSCYPRQRSDRPSRWVDQKIVSNDIPFASRAVFNAFNACFAAGTTEAFNENPLPEQITSEVKLGMDVAVLPFPALNFLGLLNEWANACGRYGEIEANQGFMASLERDCLELDAQLKSWPENDPGRTERQREIDAKKAVCLELTARNNALRAQAPPIEGRAATVGSGVVPVFLALNKTVGSSLSLNAQDAVDVTKAADATGAAELSDVAASTAAGLSIGLVNSACHLIRAFPEVNRAMEQLDGLKAAEHRLAKAFEDCRPGLQDQDVRLALDNVMASMIPLVRNTRSQARIIAADGFFRTVHGASGVALKSAGIAALVLGPAAPFAAGVVIAGLALGTGWIGWQAVRLWWAQTLRVDAAKIESQLKNDVAIAKKSLETEAGKPQLSAAMTPWLRLIEACREKDTQGPLTTFFRQAGISESVIGACQSKEEAVIDLVEPLFSAFKESLLTAMPEITQVRIDALKKRKDPRDVLNGFILDVENPDCPVYAQKNKTLKPLALTNQGNTLTLEDVQRHLRTFKSGQEVDLRGCEGHTARLLAQHFVDVRDRPRDARALEHALLTRVKLFIDLSRNSDERAIACLRGRYPGLRGQSKFGHQFVRETAEAYLRSKYAGPGFEEKLRMLKCLSDKDALVRRSSPMEWLKTYKTWQLTEAAVDMARWLADPPHVPGAGLVLPVFERHPGVSESEHDAAVSFLTNHMVGQDWAGYDLSAALRALEKRNVNLLFDSRALGETANTMAVEHALRLRHGLTSGGDTLLDPVKSLRSLHETNPRVARGVLKALMGRRYEVTGLSVELAEQVRAIRDAYGDHFLDVETKGSSVLFIPRKPGPEESRVVENLVAVASKDAHRHENWPSALITSSTLPLLKRVRAKGHSWLITRWFGWLISFLPFSSRFPLLKRLQAESRAVKALADQLQRNIDGARKTNPASFSLLWTPEYYVGTPGEHAVRAQHLRSILSDEPYDETNAVKCKDIDDTVTMMDRWSRETPKGREVLRVIAQGGHVQSRTAMHWLLDQRENLSDTQQTEIRQIAQSMPKKGGSSKPCLKALAHKRIAWRGQPKDLRYESMAQFLEKVQPESSTEKKADLDQQVINMGRVPQVFSTDSLSTANASGSEVPHGDRSSVFDLPPVSRYLKMHHGDSIGLAA